MFTKIVSRLLRRALSYKKHFFVSVAVFTICFPFKDFPFESPQSGMSILRAVHINIRDVYQHENRNNIERTPLRNIIVHEYPELLDHKEEDALCLLPCHSIVSQGVNRFIQVEMARKMEKTLKQYANLARARYTVPEFMKNIDLDETKQTHEVPTVMEYACWLADKCQMESRSERHRGLTDQLCPCLPRGLKGFVSINVTRLLQTTTNTIVEQNPEVENGGIWRPRGCRARRRLAVIVPFRDRDTHLRAFLAHTHPILQRQLIEYRIFVIEQNMPYMFNKGTVMNAGYLEAKKVYKFDCVMFYDVDTLAERDDNIINCEGDQPIHWGGYNPRFNYTYLRYLFGSAVLMRPELFESVNGFTNLFYGWGGEDDNIMKRFEQNKVEIYRGPINVTRCTLIEHPRDKLFSLSKNDTEDKLTLWGEMARDPTWKDIDGLNMTRYQVKQKKYFPTHTWIQVDLQRPVIKISEVKEREKRMQYERWHNKCSSLGYATNPLNFTVVSGICAERNRNQPRHLQSRATCRYLCELDSNCTYVEYHTHPANQLDPYCTLHAHKVCTRKPARFVEIHTKVIMI